MCHVVASNELMSDFNRSGSDNVREICRQVLFVCGLVVVWLSTYGIYYSRVA